MHHLEKRHDWALACSDNLWSTTVCAGSTTYQNKRLGYYCDGSGRLQVKGKYREEACELYCSCVNLNPQPRCFLDYSLKAYCGYKRDETSIAALVGELVPEADSSTLDLKKKQLKLLTAREMMALQEMGLLEGYHELPAEFAEQFIWEQVTIPVVEALEQRGLVVVSRTGLDVGPRRSTAAVDADEKLARRWPCPHVGLSAICSKLDAQSAPKSWVGQIPGTFLKALSRSRIFECSQTRI